MTIQNKNKELTILTWVARVGSVAMIAATIAVWSLVFMMSDWYKKRGLTEQAYLAALLCQNDKVDTKKFDYPDEFTIKASIMCQKEDQTFYRVEKEFKRN